jgi:hypothetical protein
VPPPTTPAEPVTEGLSEIVEDIVPVAEIEGVIAAVCETVIVDVALPVQLTETVALFENVSDALAVGEVECEGEPEPEPEPVLVSEAVPESVYVPLGLTVTLRESVDVTLKETDALGVPVTERAAEIEAVAEREAVALGEPLPLAVAEPPLAVRLTVPLPLTVGEIVGVRLPVALPVALGSVVLLGVSVAESESVGVLTGEPETEVVPLPVALPPVGLTETVAEGEAVCVSDVVTLGEPESVGERLPDAESEGVPQGVGEREPVAESVTDELGEEVTDTVTVIEALPLGVIVVETVPEGV